MDPAVAGLLGASIGALFGCVGQLISGRNARILESDRLNASRHGEVERLERESLLQLIRNLALAMNSVTYLTWRAEHCAETVDSQVLLEYEEFAKRGLPELFASEVAASTLSDEEFATVHALVQTVYELDEAVARAAARFPSDPQEARTELASLSEEAKRLELRAVTEMRSILRSQNTGD